MTFEDYLLLHRNKSKDKSAFENTEFLEDDVDKCVSDSEIDLIEIEHKLSLPNSYKKFCKEFGGGIFGFVVIFSLDKIGQYFIFDELDKLKKYNYFDTTQFLPFSDDGTGGVYCFKNVNGQINDNVYFIDEMGNIELTKYDFLTYLIQFAYN